jgi:exodeoxyribonuclease VII small subunit
MSNQSDGKPASVKKAIKHNSDFDFSASMRELESIADYLQSSEVDLDEAMKKYERGTQIAKQLRDYLKTAENKVETLKQSFDRD